jgi:PST family polysaccharide transporter
MRKKSLFHNTTVASIEKLISLSINILLVPIVINKLGSIEYGKWVFFLSIANYFLLAQFGVSISFKRYISEDLAKKNYNAIKEFYTTAFFSLLFLSIFLILLTYLLNPVIFSYVNIGGTIQDNSASLLFLVSVSCLALINEIAVSIPQCYQRFDIASYITIFGRFVYLSIIILFFCKHPSINNLIIAILISNFLVLFLNVLYGYKLFPQLSFSLINFKIHQLKRMISFGIKIQISFVATYFANNYDKLLIGKYMGASSITVYDIGSKIITFLREIPYVFFLIIMPFSSELFASNDTQKIKKIAIDFTKTFLIFSSVIFSFVYYSGEAILKFWIGNTINPLSVYVLHVLLIGAVLHLSTGIITSILKSAGRMQPEIIGNSVILIINLIFSTFLIMAFGIKGVVWGTSFGFIIGSIVIFYYATKILQIPFGFFMYSILKIPLINAIAILIINILIQKLVFNYFNFSDNQLIFVKIGIGITTAVFSMLLLIKLKLLPVSIFKRN